MVHRKLTTVELRGRTSLAGSWPVYFAVLTAVAVVAASRLLHLSKSLEVLIAVSVPALVALLLLGRQRALYLCIIVAAFFSGAPIKVGQLNISDVFLLVALTLAVLLPAPVEQSALRPAKSVLAGLALLIVGGFVGGFFTPAGNPFPHAFVPGPSKLFFFPPRWGEIVRFAYGTVGVILIVRACRLTRAQVEGALVGFVAGAAVSAMWAFVSPGTLARPAGFNASPVALGWISAFAATIGIGFLLAGRRTAKIVGVATVLVSCAGIAISGTRSAVPLLLVGVLIIQFGLRSARRTFVFALLAVTAFGLALVGVGSDTEVVQRLGGSAGAQLSNLGRALVRQDTIEVVKHHWPTGIGMEFLFQPHNLLLGVIATSGLIGLVGFVVVGVSLVRRLVATPSDEVLTLAVISGALATFACAWVVNVGWEHWLWLPLALILASGTRRRNVLSDDDRDPTSAHPVYVPS